MEINRKRTRGEYYVYVYLDPRKPGNYVYGEYVFDYEPFYVGKGKRKRAYYFEQHNRFLKSKIAKFGKPIVRILMCRLQETSAFTEEKHLISVIGRIITFSGPLCNFTDGGEGGSGPPNKGRVTPIETRNKISSAKKGRPSPLRGRPSPLRGRPSPSKGRPSPLKGRPSPLKGRPSPLKGRPNLALKDRLSPLKGKPGFLKGRPSPLKGRKHTTPSPLKGRKNPHSEEMKQNLSLATKGKPKSETMKMNLYLSRRGLKRKRTQVCTVTLDS